MKRSLNDLLKFEECSPEPRMRYIDALILALEVPYEEFSNGIIWTTPSGNTFSVFLEGNELAFSHPLLSDILMQAALFVKGHRLVIRPYHRDHIASDMNDLRCFYR